MKKKNKKIKKIEEEKEPPWFILYFKQYGWATLIAVMIAVFFIYVGSISQEDNSILDVDSNVTEAMTIKLPYNLTSTDTQGNLFEFQYLEIACDDRFEIFIADRELTMKDVYELIKNS